MCSLQSLVCMNVITTNVRWPVALVGMLYTGLLPW